MRDSPICVGGPSRTRIVDALIKPSEQGGAPEYPDSLDAQQIELWPEG